MNEYRVTRPNLYSNPNCPGYRNKAARQGHYVMAQSPEEAADKVRAREGLSRLERLDVEHWGADPSTLTHTHA